MKIVKVAILPTDTTYHPSNFLLDVKVTDFQDENKLSWGYRMIQDMLQ